ncbi:hypothetical protein SCA03_21040 [Streptomyces cacaoi]|uniref:Uncharacterized protein n=1 Tax=Streptomyces cacaoi TaxID=1898 RepID=A0A4Y3QY80_STRCI|nr:hypothetical protein SCA03_21040 [Streptomyces cacaoi]
MGIGRECGEFRECTGCRECTGVHEGAESYRGVTGSPAPATCGRLRVVLRDQFCRGAAGQPKAVGPDRGQRPAGPGAGDGYPSGTTGQMKGMRACL